MARFDVYRAQASTLLLDVQAYELQTLGRRVVVPLHPLTAVPKPMAGLHPIFGIDGQDFAMVTHRLGSVPARQLRNPVANLAPYRDDITRALDTLFTGF